MSFDLFQLVPAVHRLRDGQIAAAMSLLTSAEQAQLATLEAITTALSADEQAELDALIAKSTRGPLQSLLMVIGEQLEILAEDLDQLYDDQFIETCAPWVIPYIGDLIGYQAIHGITPAVDNPRTEVAETISLRRRKGTVLVLEQLARDITGWGAHALEFFQILGDTQYTKHVRRWNDYAPDVRSWKPRYFRDRGFSHMTRKVDVRLSEAPGLPRYNIQNVGVFLWSLGAYPITNSPVTPSSANAPGAADCYRFSSLGADMPLFHRATSQGDQITTPARPNNVPDYLSRLELCDDMQRGVGASYYGEGSSLALYLNGQLLNPWQVQVANLSGPEGGWANLPAAGSPYAVLIDPDLGRAAVLPPPAGGTAPVLTTSYRYGFNAPIGGGEYARAADFTVDDTASVFPFPDTAATPRYTDLQGALDFIVGELGVTGSLALELDGSGVVAPAGGLSLDLPAGTTVELRAREGSRPTLLLNGEVSITGDADSTFVINGLIVAAGVGMTPKVPSPAALIHAPTLRPGGKPSELAVLDLTDCTLVPGWALGTDRTPLQPTAPGVIAEPPGLQVTAERAILGAILASELVEVSLCDSVLDATDPAGVAYAALDGKSGGGALTMLGCTAVGKVHATLLSLVSNSIVWATAGDWVSGLIADRKQSGCVRFSFLPVNARTPQRFECVEAALASPQPIFFTLRYGEPAYAKLLACTDDVIRRGADDGGEMGAFHFLLGPLRETDLVLRLQEYTPVGLSVGLIYQT